MGDVPSLDEKIQKKKIQDLRKALLTIMSDIDYLEGHYFGMLDAIQEAAELHISSVRTQILELVDKVPELKGLFDDERV